MNLREDMGGAPSCMKSRPIDHRGFYVPWFVTEKTDDGLWDFQVVTPSRRNEAIRKNLCWVSGQELGVYQAFVIGPMCTINRVAGDPPVKREVGLWSAMVCPFLSRPLAKRPEISRPRMKDPHMVEGNPGLCAVWVTKNYRLSDRAPVFHLGYPESLTWFTKGRKATKKEVSDGFALGADRLLRIAAEEEQGASMECHRMINAAAKMIGIIKP